MSASLQLGQAGPCVCTCDASAMSSCSTVQVWMLLNAARSVSGATTRCISELRPAGQQHVSSGLVQQPARGMQRCCRCSTAHAATQHAGAQRARSTQNAPRLALVNAKHAASGLAQHGGARLHCLRGRAALAQPRVVPVAAHALAKQALRMIARQRQKPLLGAGGGAGARPHGICGVAAAAVVCAATQAEQQQQQQRCMSILLASSAAAHSLHRPQLAPAPHLAGPGP